MELVCLQTWMNNILPRIFGWKSVFTGRPKLQQLFEAMRADPHAKRVSIVCICCYQASHDVVFSDERIALHVGLVLNAG